MPTDRQTFDASKERLRVAASTWKPTTSVRFRCLKGAIEGLRQILANVRQRAFRCLKGAIEGIGMECYDLFHYCFRCLKGAIEG